MDSGVFPGSLGSMHMHTMAAKCWSFKYAASEEFKQIMAQVLVNAKCLADELLKHGFDLIGGTTDNHMVIADLRPKNITGKQFQNVLDSIGITVSKQQIPDDPKSPLVTSGVRIGVTSITQRGLKEPGIKKIVDIMDRVAMDPENEDNLAECKAQAKEIISAFPLYPEGLFDD